MGSNASCFACVDRAPEEENKVQALPTINGVVSFSEYMTDVVKTNALARMKERYVLARIVDRTTGLMTTETYPYNALARLAAGVQENTVDQRTISFRSEFMVCHADVVLAGLMADPDETGPGHVLITNRCLDWRYSNVASIVTLSDGVSFLQRLKLSAEHYSEQRKWKRSGYFLKCYPHTNEHSLHLHVVNLDRVNATFAQHAHSNLHIDDAIFVAFVGRNKGSRLPY